MTQSEILIGQTSDAYNWTNRLIETLSLDKWDVIPEVMESSINWQVGHLIVSHYFHAVMVVRGHQMDILKTIPMKEYSDLFAMSPPAHVGTVNSEKLLHDLKFMQEKSLGILGTMSDKELGDPLEPSPTPHPIARTKFEAIDWNIKHTMYHCGQIGMIRRVIDKRYDFGLRIHK